MEAEPDSAAGAAPCAWQPARRETAAGAGIPPTWRAARARQQVTRGLPTDGQGGGRFRENREAAARVGLSDARGKQEEEIGRLAKSVSARVHACMR